jgi:hypothetical protein
MNTARFNFGMVVLGDGRVMAVGGQSSTATLSSAEIYDPGQNKWTTTGGLSEGRFAITPILLKNGMVAVAGGNKDTSTYSNAVDLFNPDPLAGGWTPLTPLTTTRANFYVAPLDNGRFAMLGGKFPVYNPVTQSNVNVNAGVGTNGGAVAIYDAAATDVDGNIIGANKDSASQFFKTEGRAPNSAISNLNAIVLPGGNILLVAGSIASFGVTSTSEIWNPGTDTLTAGPTLSTGQGDRVLAVSIQNAYGDVLIYGGDRADAIAQIYRPQ